MAFVSRLRNRLRYWALVAERFKYRHFWGMDIGLECDISMKALLDKTNPRGVHIDDYTSIAFGAVILSHDFIRNIYLDTWIGKKCSIGANAIIYPGVRVGDGSIVAPGSVVMKDVPAASVVAGNPARVIEQGIVTGKWGVRYSDIPVERRDPATII